ncbi:MAG: hypothetical protein Q7T79_03285 [bacterium]|nr:hypothetical protein [bacterium]
MSREERQARLQRRFEQADAAFNGQYKEELEVLHGLSKAEIDALTPDTTDLLVYNKLICIVKEASSQNITQAELIDNIKELGQLGIKIAKKVPKLASLF